jgi:hypothetical protein
MDDTHPKQHTKEEKSGAPTFFAENQLDPSLDLVDQQFSKLNFHRRNSAISEVEKSFKDEEHIYVCVISASVCIS